MSIGQRIKERREALGLTLEAVGSTLGVHRSTILRYESGDTRRIPLPVIEQLAGILQTTPTYLMGWQTAEEAGADLDPEIRLIARSMQKMPREKRDMLIKIINTMSDIADEELKKP
jgi:transcriptional regulator with XRE-family HTH domain